MHSQQWSDGVMQLVNCCCCCCSRCRLRIKRAGPETREAQITRGAKTDQLSDCRDLYARHECSAGLCRVLQCSVVGVGGGVSLFFCQPLCWCFAAVRWCRTRLWMESQRALSPEAHNTRRVATGQLEDCFFCCVHSGGVVLLWCGVLWLGICGVLHSRCCMRHQIRG